MTGNETSGVSGVVSGDMTGKEMSGTGSIQPREGSTLYYSLLWTPLDARARFLDTLTLIKAIATTFDDVQDASVAERKLHWWHEELGRLLDGTPRHPGTTACKEALGGHSSAQEHLLAVLSVASTTRFEPATTDAAHRERLQRDHQSRLALLIYSLDREAEALSGSGGAQPLLATGLGLRDQLARLPTLLHRGQAVFSDERYARHDTSPAALARCIRRAPDGASDMAADGPADAPRLNDIPVVSAGGDRHALIAECVDEAHDALSAALAEPAFRQTFSDTRRAPMARLIALRHRELALWRSHRPDLLRERTSLTPFRRFLVAWRHKRGVR